MNANINWWYGLHKQQTSDLQRAFKSIHKPRTFELYNCLKRIQKFWDRSGVGVWKSESGHQKWADIDI